MEQLRLTGEYTLNIVYHRMFETYNARFHHHNLITDDGLEFLAKKWANTFDLKDGKRTHYNIVKMIVGENDSLPNPSDNINTFIKQDGEENPFDIDVHSDGAMLKLTSNNVSGRILNSTTEIGVIGEITTETYDEYNEDIVETEVSNPILISRDTHPIINIPSTCIVNIEYIYKLTSKNNDECAEE